MSENDEHPTWPVRLLRFALVLSILGFFGGCAGQVFYALADPQAAQSPQGNLALVAMYVTFALGSGFALSLNVITAPPRTPPQTREQRIDSLAETLRSSGRLVDELQAEMTSQQASLVRIRAEQQEAENLAVASRAESEALRALIDATVERAEAEVRRTGRRRERINITLGTALGLVAGIAGNYIYDYLIIVSG